ncbi:hypothetical protein [Persephonella sp.]
MDQTSKERQLKIYELKTEVLHLLQDLKKDLKLIIEDRFLDDNTQKNELEKFFKDKEYVDLNMFLSKSLSVLEKPATTVESSELTILKEKESLKEIISSVINRLEFTVHKLDKLSEKAQWILDQLSFRDYMDQVKKELENNLEKAISRTLSKDINKLKQKLKKIDSLNNYEELKVFQKQLEGEVNLYISQDIFPKIEHIFNNYKKDLAKKIDQYVQKLHIDPELKGKINEELSEMVDSFSIKASQFYYIAPEFPPDIFNHSRNFSEFEILKENLPSTRFIAIFTSGLLLLFIGLMIPDSMYELIVAGLGGILTLYSVIDSIYFNDYFYKKYLSMIRAKIKREFEKSLENIKEDIKEKLMKISEKFEKNISHIVEKETKDIHNYLLDINSIKKIYTRYIEQLHNFSKSVEEV